MQTFLETITTATSAMIWGESAAEEEAAADQAASREEDSAVMTVTKPRIFAVTSPTGLGAAGASTFSHSQVGVVAAPTENTTNRRLKVLIRGSRKTGKTTLFRKLQGLPAVDPLHSLGLAARAAAARKRSGAPNASSPLSEDLPYTPSQAIDVMRFSWRRNTIHAEFNVWDVVDKGTPMPMGSSGYSFSDPHGGVGGNGSGGPYGRGGAFPAGGLRGATKAIMKGAPKNLPMMPVDATTIEVYKGGGDADLVIFLYDRSRRETFDYVVDEVRKVPRGCPIIIGSNFSDRPRGGTRVGVGMGGSEDEGGEAVPAASSGVTFEEEQALLRSIPSAVSSFVQDAMTPVLDALRTRHSAEALDSSASDETSSVCSSSASSASDTRKKSRRANLMKKNKDKEGRDPRGRGHRELLKHHSPTSPQNPSVTSPKGLCVPPLLISLCLPCGYGLKPLHAALESVVAFHRAKELEAQSRICYGLAEKALADATLADEEQTFKSYATMLRLLDQRHGTRESETIPRGAPAGDDELGNNMSDEGRQQGRGKQTGKKANKDVSKGKKEVHVRFELRAKCSSSSATSSSSEKERYKKANCSRVVDRRSPASPNTAVIKRVQETAAAERFGQPPEGFEATRRADVGLLDTNVLAGSISGATRSAIGRGGARDKKNVVLNDFLAGLSDDTSSTSADEKKKRNEESATEDDRDKDSRDRGRGRESRDNDNNNDDGGDRKVRRGGKEPSPPLFLTSKATERVTNVAKDSEARRLLLAERKAHAEAEDATANGTRKGTMQRSPSASLHPEPSLSFSTSNAAGGAALGGRVEGNLSAMIEKFKQQLEEAQIEASSSSTTDDDDTHNAIAEEGSGEKVRKSKHAEENTTAKNAAVSSSYHSYHHRIEANPFAQGESEKRGRSKKERRKREAEKQANERGAKREVNTSEEEEERGHNKKTKDASKQRREKKSKNSGSTKKKPRHPSSSSSSDSSRQHYANPIELRYAGSGNTNTAQPSSNATRKGASNNDDSTFLRKYDSAAGRKSGAGSGGGYGGSDQREDYHRASGFFSSGGAQFNDNITASTVGGENKGLLHY